MTQETNTAVTGKNTSALDLAKDVAKAASELKAQNIKILDLSGLTTFTDYFVVVSGTSDRHVASIADSIVHKMKQAGHMPIGVEGYEHAQWVIVDFGDVVVHVFYQAMRDVYAIEKFWADAKVVRFSEPRRPAKKSAAKKPVVKKPAKKSLKKPAKKAVAKKAVVKKTTSKKPVAKKVAKKVVSRKKSSKKGKK